MNQKSNGFQGTTYYKTRIEKWRWICATEVPQKIIDMPILLCIVVLFWYLHSVYLVKTIVYSILPQF